MVKNNKAFKKTLRIMTFVLVLFIMALPFAVSADTEAGYWTTQLDSTGNEVEVFVYNDEPLEITVLENNDKLCDDNVGEEVLEKSRVNDNIKLVVADKTPQQQKAEVQPDNTENTNSVDYTLVAGIAFVVILLSLFGYCMIKAI